ncbi:hypothetical protein ACV35P_34625, partial [Pseudomonas aeruginosa]
VIALAMFLIIAVCADATFKSQFHECDVISTLFIELYRHAAVYALQGPVLFDRFYQGSIHLEPYWSPLNGFCSILPTVGLCQKP